MKLKAHLQSNQAPALVGQLSFQSFLQIGEKLASHSIDDLGLAVQNDRYKVYSFRIPATKRTELNDLVSRYKSMSGIKFWLDNVVPENVAVSLFFSAYFKDQWLMDYGIALGQDMYVVGKFVLNAANLKALPDSIIIKDFKYRFAKYDFRVHTLLDNIRTHLRFIDLGHCSRTDAQVIDSDVVVSCYGLGVWEKKGGGYKWEDGEADKYSKLFQQWVRKRPWWELVKLTVTPYNNGWVDFTISLR